MWKTENVRVSLVVVCHTVDAAVMVHGERNPVQSLGAHHAAETAGVVRVPQSLQDLTRNTRNDVIMKILTAFLVYFS